MTNVVEENPNTLKPEYDRQQADGKVQRSKAQWDSGKKTNFHNIARIETKQRGDWYSSTRQDVLDNIGDDQGTIGESRSDFGHL